MQEAINELLIREFRSGRRTIIVIDEAQSLDTSVLETIRLLSNFETEVRSCSRLSWPDNHSWHKGWRILKWRSYTSASPC